MTGDMAALDTILGSWCHFIKFGPIGILNDWKYLVMITKNQLAQPVIR